MHFRPATRNDVPAIVRLLASDPLGARREDYRDPLPEAYYTAFANIAADSNQELIVVTDVRGVPRGCGKLRSRS